MLQTILMLFWMCSAIYICYIYMENTKEITWSTVISLVIVTLIFSPFIILIGLGAKITQTIINKLDSHKTIQIAIVQFKPFSNDAIGKTISKLIKTLHIHWYYFDENENRDFAIKDLKQHYDIVLEIIEL